MEPTEDLQPVELAPDHQHVLDVIASAGEPHFVAHHNHRNPERQHRNRKEVLHLLVP